MTAEAQQFPGVSLDFTSGDRLRKAREHTGMSKDQFAEVTGISRNTIAKWEAASTLPRRYILEVWSAHTGVDYEWLSGAEVPSYCLPLADLRVPAAA